MSKFRKKPVVIEAVQFNRHSEPFPEEFEKAICGWRYEDCEQDTRGPHIHTLEGIHYITADDWIIKGIKGEFYPCKPDIFEATYEAVDE